MDQVDRSRSWARWQCAWMLASSPGVCLAVLMWGVGTTLVLAVAAALLGGVLPLVARAQAVDLRSTVAAAHVRTVAAVSLVVTGVVALTTVSPAAGLLVLVVLAATTPTSQAWLGRRPWSGAPVTTYPTEGPDGPRLPQRRSPVPDWARRGLPAEPVHDARLLALAAPGMTTSELCRAWRHSFVALRQADTPGERARLATLRQSYLDEIETRNPAALQAWFASGARAASGPERFLAPPRSRPPAT